MADPPFGEYVINRPLDSRNYYCYGPTAVVVQNFDRDDVDMLCDSGDGSCNDASYSSPRAVSLCVINPLSSHFEEKVGTGTLTSSFDEPDTPL